METKEFTINIQNDVIDVILMALEETVLGKGIAAACTIEIKRGSYGSTIVFTPTGEIQPTAQMFFELGFIIGRDYKPELSGFKVEIEQEKKPKKK